MMKSILLFFIILSIGIKSNDAVSQRDHTLILSTDAIMANNLPDSWQLCHDANVYPYASDTAPLSGVLPSGTVVKLLEKSPSKPGWIMIGVNPVQWIYGGDLCPRGGK